MAKPEIITKIDNLQTSVQSHATQLAEKAKQTDLDNVNSRITQIITAPVDGSITQQEIIDARQGALSLGTNLTDIKDTITRQGLDFVNQADMVMSNIIKNGGFQNTNKEWYISGASGTLKFIDGTCEITTLQATSGILQNIVLNPSKYYFSYKHKATAGTNTFIRLEGVTDIINKPISTTWTRYSTILNVVNPFSNQCKFLFSGQTTGNKIYLDDIMIIDLTAVFGAGNEPTQAEVDYIVDNISTNWVTGTTPLSQKMVYDKLLKTINNGISSQNLIQDDITGIKYRWSIKISNGIPSINLVEVI